MKIREKAIRILLRAMTSIAFLFLLAITNITCIGPGYQPELPDETEKYRIK